MITLLEDDKRAGEEHELSVLLSYSQVSFSVPNNLYVIGTMNTADRSIALLDVALRRRFAFVEVMPRSELLEGVKIDTESGEIRLDRVLLNLNEFISGHIDRDHQIGHSYLMQVASAKPEQRAAKLKYVWINQILPLLHEYFYRQRETLARLLSDMGSQREDDFLDGIQSEEDLFFLLWNLSKQ